jgi:V/A-type H+-transporting ATPase subunit A
VQELITLPVLGRARRVKSVYRSEQIEEMKGFRREIETAFDTLGAEYHGTRKLA